MRSNELRNVFARGGTVLNGWLAIANSYSAELMAHQGFDSVTVDLQHGPVDFQAALGMLQAISTTPAVPMVRVGVYGSADLAPGAGSGDSQVGQRTYWGGGLEVRVMPPLLPAPWRTWA